MPKCLPFIAMLGYMSKKYKKESWAFSHNFGLPFYVLLDKKKYP